MNLTFCQGNISTVLCGVCLVPIVTEIAWMSVMLHAVNDRVIYAPDDRILNLSVWQKSKHINNHKCRLNTHHYLPCCSTIMCQDLFCRCNGQTSTPMMTSWNRNSFRVSGPLWGESTGHRWIPLTMANDAELWCFLWTAPERKRVEQTIETPVIWEAILLIMTSL